jgi:hypothetical protein
MPWQDRLCGKQLVHNHGERSIIKRRINQSTYCSIGARNSRDDDGWLLYAAKDLTLGSFTKPSN